MENHYIFKFTIGSNQSFFFINKIKFVDMQIRIVQLN